MIIPEESKNINEQENQLEDINSALYTQEDIPSIAAAAGVYITAFSNPPYNEKWEVGDSSSFNPNDLNQLTDFLVNVLQRPQDIEIKGNNSEQEILFDGINIKTKYPLANIINAYSSAVDNKEAVLLVRSNGSLFRLSDGEKMSKEDMANSDAIVRLVNYLPENGSVSDQLLDEVGYYLKREEKEDFKENIEEKKSVYFGEVVNLRENISGQAGFILTSFKEYFEKYKDDLPEQIIYMTKPGTSIQNSDRNSQFMDRILQKAFQGRTIEKTIKHYNQDSAIIYIFKVKSEN